MVLASINLNDTDRRLLISAIIILTLIFIIFALLGALIRVITLSMGKRLDNLVSDAVRYRVLENKKHFKKYARIKNRRLFVKEASIGFVIILVSVLFYVIYGAITHEWTRNYWTEFGTLFYQWDFGNDSYYAIVWGVKILSSWPALTNAPHLVASYWPSYCLCILWIIGTLWLLIASWAYLSRSIFIRRRARSIYSKSLENFNYYDSFYPGNGEPNPTAINKKSEKDTSSSPK